MPTCVNNVKLYWANSIPNIATDLALLLFPLPIIWNLQLPASHKLSLTGIFAIGGLWVSQVKSFSCMLIQRRWSIIVASSLRLAAVLEAESNALDITCKYIPLPVIHISHTNLNAFRCSNTAWNFQRHRNQLRNLSSMSTKYGTPTPYRSSEISNKDVCDHTSIWKLEVSF